MPGDIQLGDEYSIEEDVNNNLVITHIPSGSTLTFDSVGDLFEFAAEARFGDVLTDTNGKTIYNPTTGTVGDGTTDADHSSVDVSTLTGDSGVSVYTDSTKTVGDGTTSANHASVSTENANNVRQVPQFGSIQQAHDDLPADGGVIEINDSISETGVSLTKPVSILGSGAMLFSSENNRVQIDVSGGDGVHIDSVGVTLRDVAIVGDGTTGSYGLKLGTTGEFIHSVTVDNVSVDSVSGDGVLVEGQHLGHNLDVLSTGATRDGWHFGLSSSGDYFNANTINRLFGRGCGRDGIHIGSSVSNGLSGNTIQHIHAEVCDRWGVFHEDGTTFSSNAVFGYGTENNAQGGTGGEIHMDTLPSNTESNIWVTGGDPSGVYALEIDDPSFVIRQIANQPFYSTTNFSRFGAREVHFEERTSSPSLAQPGYAYRCDGTGWDPIGDGNPHIVVRTESGGWVSMANLS